MSLRIHGIALAAVLLATGAAPQLISHALAQNAQPQATQRLNPNTATAAQLKAIPLLSADLISEIEKGKPYASMSAFNKVVSAKLSAEQAQQVYASLFVPINLNTASREDVALIPALPARMVREFFEYRPWTSMEQFNREIGKYVDPAETARLASYVTLK